MVLRHPLQRVGLGEGIRVKTGSRPPWIQFQNRGKTGGSARWDEHMTEQQLRQLADETTAEIERIKSLPIAERRVAVEKILSEYDAAAVAFLKCQHDLTKAAFRFFGIPLAGDENAH